MDWNPFLHPNDGNGEDVDDGDAYRRSEEGSSLQPHEQQRHRCSLERRRRLRRRDPWPIPDTATMARRRAYREGVLRETADQRRIHPHGGMGDTGRNILHVLYDRERKGSASVTVPRLRRVPRLGHGGSLRGDRSPSTVFESPISTAAAASMLYDNRDPAGVADGVGVGVGVGVGGTSSPSRSTMMDDDEMDVGGIGVGVGVGIGGDDADAEKTKTPRRVSYPSLVEREIRTFGEYCSAVKYHSAFLHHLGGNDQLDEDGHRPASSTAVSTISVAFSPDARTMASTHGDHTVKISSCNTGALLQSLEGHPRTPWTVKYHPTDPAVVASGCLGHQVRVWNWMDKTCLQMIRLEFAIISLSFHPSGHLLAVANGTRLHFWGIDDDRSRVQHRQHQQNAVGESAPCAASGTASSSSSSRPRPVNRASFLTEMDQRHMLRCVHFPPAGDTIIIGGVNPASAAGDDPRQPRGARARGGIGAAGGGMSFYLRLWDFDLEMALSPPANSTTTATATAGPTGLSLPRRSISNPRTFVPRALLYNDGGFDVSPDGKTLCACAEYWLPDGVDNAMELLHKEELAYEAEAERILREREQNENERVHDDDPRDAAGTDASRSAGDNAAAVAGQAPSVSETQSAVTAALTKLRGISKDNSTATIANLSCRSSPSLQEGGSVGASCAVGNGDPAAAETLSGTEGAAAVTVASISNGYPETPAAAAGGGAAGGSGSGGSAGSCGSGSGTATAAAAAQPGTPVARSTSASPALDYVPQTPPNPRPQSFRLSPPSPPGRRFAGGLQRSSQQQQQHLPHQAHSSGGGYHHHSGPPHPHQAHPHHHHHQHLHHRAVSTQGGGPLPSSSSGVGGVGGGAPAGTNAAGTEARGLSTPPPPPPPPPPPAPGGVRPPHPLSVLSDWYSLEQGLHPKGRYVPHVVTVSLDTAPIPEECCVTSGSEGCGGGRAMPSSRGVGAGAHGIRPYGAVAKGYRPRLGQLLEACPLDVSKASAVTCVKFSPSTDFCLIGYGVREPVVEGGGHYHPVTALYRIRGGLQHVSTMLSAEDDVNIARFHPESGHGFVYGTKQGRVRVLAPMPWNFYHC